MTSPYTDALGDHTVMSEPACPSCSNVRCVAVGDLPTRSFFAGRYLDEPIAGGRLFRCPECTLAFRWPVLSDARYLELYDSGCDTHWQDSEIRTDYRLLAREIQSSFPCGGSVLDVGCNNGNFLAGLDSRYILNGIEVNVAAGVSARDRGIAVWHSVSEVPKETKFDVVTAIDVIEHIRDPRAFLAELIPLLKPHGMLLISTGDADNAAWRRVHSRWWYCGIPEHISFISKTWCSHHVTSLGLELGGVRTFRYLRLPLPRFVLDSVMAATYACAPSLYLRSMRCVMRVLGKSGDPPIRGVGLTQDHIFVLLKRLDRDGKNAE